MLPTLISTLTKGGIGRGMRRDGTGLSRTYARNKTSHFPKDLSAASSSSGILSSQLESNSQRDCLWRNHRPTLITWSPLVAVAFPCICIRQGDVDMLLYSALPFHSPSIPPSPSCSRMACWPSAPRRAGGGKPIYPSALRISFSPAILLIG